METPAEMWDQLLDSLHLTAREFMSRIGGHESTFSGWKRGVRPERKWEQGILDVYGVALERDRSGNVTGHRKLSADDIASPTTYSDIPRSLPRTEEEMVERYEEISRSVSVPRWEDLDDRARADIRAEWELARIEMERMYLAARAAVIRIALKRHD